MFSSGFLQSLLLFSQHKSWCDSCSGCCKMLEENLVQIDTLVERVSTIFDRMCSMSYYGFNMRLVLMHCDEKFLSDLEGFLISCEEELASVSKGDRNV